MPVSVGTVPPQRNNLTSPTSVPDMSIEALARRPWNTVACIALLAFALSALAFIPDFVAHTRSHFTGSVSASMIEGRWHVVALNILIFVSFLIPLSFRRKADWKEYGLVVAFFVSLFVEMYGIPFLLVAASTRLAPGGTEPLVTPVHFDFMGVEFAFTVPMVYGTILMLVGMALIMVAWYQLWKGVQKDELVTNGLYAVSRNPQYLGFIIVIVGWLVGWPTILVVVFTPILLFMYIRLCLVEEKELADIAGYEEYRKDVPLII